MVILPNDSKNLLKFHLRTAESTETKQSQNIMYKNLNGRKLPHPDVYLPKTRHILGNQTHGPMN